LASEDWAVLHIDTNIGKYESFMTLVVDDRDGESLGNGGLFWTDMTDCPRRFH
jgi:hypothetical protein